ncbi:hypothetical protein [Deinococcus radiophilus]|uniref:Uncharacterized protein n=1 Tax=Deinococcus radiophilus TaxID=32062 RepID=A0A3S0R9N6_9DEIO|nr:hypothetical protein [Deinococcus radiophilus]RTR21386.1 hypothetical protein EJ104_13015 [Deinococcus radiophilus]UFA52079.1 hypothetical protein LMT64_14115 [Deinococcus radiophilus]
MANLAVRAAHAEAIAAKLMAQVHARLNFGDQPEPTEQPQTAPQQVGEQRPTVLPDFVPDVQRYLRDYRNQKAQTRIADSAENLTALMTAPDWTNPEAEARAAQEAQDRATQRERVQTALDNPAQADTALTATGWGRYQLDELLDLEALRPKRGRGAGTEGATALARLLDHLARHTARARGYSPNVSQVVIHCPAELLAGYLGANRATVWRWTQKLEQLGYVDARSHHSSMTLATGESMTVATGTLYAVRMQPNTRAHLHGGPEGDFAEDSRTIRDMDADRAARKTSYAVLSDIGIIQPRNSEFIKMQQSKEFTEDSVTLHTLYTFVTPNLDLDNPRYNDCCIFSESSQTGITDAAAELATMQETGPTQSAEHMAATVHRTAELLAQGLEDTHSVAYWAKQIWMAYRAGRCPAFAATLTRLTVQLRELDNIRSRAAWVVAELQRQEGKRPPKRRFQSITATLAEAAD